MSRPASRPAKATTAAVPGPLRGRVMAGRRRGVTSRKRSRRRNDGPHRRQEASQEHGGIAVFVEERFAALDHERVVVQRPNSANAMRITMAEPIGQAVADRRSDDRRRQYSGQTKIAGGDQRAEAENDGRAGNERT